MLKTKLISFEIEPSKTTDSAKELKELVNLHKSGQPVSLEDWQKAGVPVGKRLLERRGIVGCLAPIIKGLFLLENELLVPETIFVPREKFRIMKNGITAGQFKQFMENSGYEITGNTAHKLIAELASAQKEDCLKWLSVLDGKAYAKWLSAQTKGKWSVLTKAEWETVNRLVGNNLSEEEGEWTEGANGKSEIVHVDRHWTESGHIINALDQRYGNDRVRLVVKIPEEGEMSKEAFQKSVLISEIIVYQKKLLD